MDNHVGGKLKWEKWGRSGEYCIKKIKDREYICPIPDSGYITYDIDTLLEEKSGKKANENYLVLSILNLDTSKKEAVIDFVSRFGLLGLLPHKYLEPQLAVIDGNKYYLVPERNGCDLHHVEEVAQNYLINVEDFINTGFYSIRKNMSEPLDEFIEAIQEFQNVAKWVYAIKKAEEGIGAPLRALFIKEPSLAEISKKDIRDMLPPAKLLLHMLLTGGNQGLSRSVIQAGKETWQIRLGFESLLSAAYYFFTQDLAGRYRLDQCKRCNKLFMTSVKKRKFCSRKCEDAKRKADSRSGKKEEKQHG
ncbi:hypothetical protein [Pelotomaculum sp. PtaB.Bin117]|uniref:hypothetical protein n=1 Tax=Pelotomaculum sp. PtaB.Bin117 TaxID=1811694 RepID=UPI0009D38493|nr:hypothetical protein [Pelotomaculum sp. PtaB.Bin117]OPX85729.1 MAG: hypothetical protein A4E54_02267 [Pelotomaculum sp. PtaB.Bin117]